VALTFAGVVKFDQIDEQNHVARVSAQGTDAKGRGGANAKSEFRLEPAGAGSKVLVHTNLTLSGAVAQYGRGVGIIQATAAQLMNQFAKNLRERFAPAVSQPGAAVSSAIPAASASAAAPARANVIPTPAAAPPPAKPISGFTLMAKAVWAWIIGLFKQS